MVMCVLPGINLTIKIRAASYDACIACVRSPLLPLTKEGLGCRRLYYLQVPKPALTVGGVDMQRALKRLVKAGS